MNKHKLVLSIALGALLTMGLLVGFSLSRNAALASTADPKTVERTNTGEAIQAQDAVSTAYVVVRFGDNDTVVREITFTQPITAYTALQQTGLDLDIIDMGWGLMLCGIDGVGKSLPDGSGCDNGTRYWGTSYWGDNAWVGRMVGVGQAVISQTGHVEGFSWSDPNYSPVDPSPAPPLTSAHKALSWLQDQQQADGGFGNANSTSEALMAVSANGIDASTWRHSPSLLANMLSNGTDFANKNAAGVGKLAVALAAQDSCWPIGAKKPISYYDPISGTFSVDTLYQAWGILGTAALSETVPVSAVESLKDNQLPNGGWEWAVDMGADTNATALALQALIAAGEPVTSSSVVSGLAYLEDAQNDDGGFPYSPESQWGTDSDTNSTAYVVQALFAAGEDPLTGTWTVTNSNPISYLLSMQLPDGSFEWQKDVGPNQLATQQAIPALLHRAYPMDAVDLESCYGLSGSVSETGAVGAQAINDAVSDVTVWAEGAGDLYFGTTDATGHYTASVPSTGTYDLTPSKGNYVFSPTSRTVEVSGDPGDVTSVEEEFVSGGPDLSIVKTSNVDTVSPGDHLTYTITVSNAGPFAASNVVVTDLLPSEVTPPSLGTVILADPPGTIVMPQKMRWSLGTLEVDESTTVTLKVKVQSGATGEFTNTAVITSDVADDTPGNNESSIVVEVEHNIYLPLVVRNSS